MVFCILREVLGWFPAGLWEELRFWEIEFWWNCVFGVLVILLGVLCVVRPRWFWLRLFRVWVLR